MKKYIKYLLLVVVLSCVSGVYSQARIPDEPETPYGDYNFYDYVTIGTAPNVTEDTLFCVNKGGDSVAIVSISRYNGWGQPNIPNSTRIPEQVKNWDTGKYYRVTTISGNAYNGVPIYGITLPATLKRIENYAFAGSNLIDITIPDSVFYIARLNRPFNGCNSLIDIHVSPNNQTFSSIDGILFDKSQDTLITYPEGRRRTSYLIPECVKHIGQYAFVNNGWLDTLVCEMNVPPTLSSNAFFEMQYTTILRVSYGAIDTYKAISGYLDSFKDIIGFSDVTDITENSAVLKWRPDTAVVYYDIDVYQQTTLVAHYEVNGQGQLISPVSPVVHKMKKDTTSSSTDYYVLTINDLSANTSYNYNISGKNSQNVSVYHELGSFTTREKQTTSVSELSADDPNKARKIYLNGQMLIEKNGKFYNAVGVEVK